MVNFKTVKKDAGEVIAPPLTKATATITVFGASEQDFKELLKLLSTEQKQDKFQLVLTLNGEIAGDDEYRQYAYRSPIHKIGTWDGLIRQATVFTHQVKDGRGTSRLITLIRNRPGKPFLGVTVEQTGTDEHVQFRTDFWWASLAMVREKVSINVIKGQRLEAAIPGWHDEYFYDRELGYLSQLDYEKWFLRAIGLTFQRVRDPAYIWIQAPSSEKEVSEDCVPVWEGLFDLAQQTPLFRLEQYFLREQERGLTLSAGATVNKLIVPENIWDNSAHPMRVEPEPLPEPSRSRLAQLLPGRREIGT